jgi:tetratricopeptide (TPR) repeat protein
MPKFPGKSMAGHDEERQPTPDELRTRLLNDAALQIASRLVNTTESLDVLLARGGALDQANTLMEQKLWTRALEALDTMTPFAQPEEDAYRLYNLGVANEALGYQADDVVKARKYLQEASVDYGKAIDAKPAEKNFLQPQIRIDSALAHYKRLGDLQVASAKTASSTSAAAADALTNKDVISMISAKLDEANVIDTVQHATAVNFDLTPKGQIDLAKANVSGRIIAAMKQRARQ